MKPLRFEFARLRNPSSLVFEIGPLALTFVVLGGVILFAWLINFALWIADHIAALL